MTRQEHIELVAREFAKVRHNYEGAWPFYTVSAAAAITALERAGAYVGECEDCGGCGYKIVSVAVCCERPTSSGECCCNPVEGQQQEPCSACGGSGKNPPELVGAPPTHEQGE